jgi:hypothetical protein
MPDRTQIFQLSCQFVDTDGTHFGYKSVELTIGHFTDVIPLLNLTVIPAHLKAEILSIRSQVMRRGKLFEALRGCHYKSYSGDYVIPSAPWSSLRTQNVCPMLFTILFLS